MRHIDGSLDADHLDHKNDLKKDIFRRKAQLNQVKTLNFKNIRWKIIEKHKSKLLTYLQQCLPLF